MIKYDNEKAGRRLRYLREEVGGWSLAEMAKVLDDKIGMNNKNASHHVVVLDNNSGRQVVSRFEKGERLTIDIAFAYADIFGVSVDYVLGRIDSWQPENIEISKQLGLTDKSIAVLRRAFECKDLDTQSVAIEMFELRKQRKEDTKEYIELDKSLLYYQITKAINILLEDEFEKDGSFLLREMADFICNELYDDISKVICHVFGKEGEQHFESEFETITVDALLGSKLFLIQKTLSNIRERRKAGGLKK